MSASMSVAWLLGLVVAALAVYGLLQLGKKRELSDEEFERESKRPSLIRTGLQEVQGFLEPEKRTAIVEVRKEQTKVDQAVPADPPIPE
jgi:hypothetical protein